MLVKEILKFITVVDRTILLLWMKELQKHQGLYIYWLGNGKENKFIND